MKRCHGTWRSRPVLGLIGMLLLAPALGLVAPAQAGGGLTFVVDSTADTGDASPDGTCNSCTFREAIQEANANPGADTITFSIAGAGPHTIQPVTALPNITDPVTIDGYTEPGAVANVNAAGALSTQLQILLSGASAPGATRGLVVANGAPGTLIRGLVISAWPSDGIQVLADNVTIQGDFIGTDVAGTADLGNGQGIHVAADNATIGGLQPDQRNLIAGNGFSGVSINGSNAVVQGNLIGTANDAASDLGNGLAGISIIGAVSAGNTIGGTEGGAGNVIAFNDRSGIELGLVGSGNRILGNAVFANGEPGIDLGDDGPTPNDRGDRDPGPNRLQNFPKLLSASSDVQPRIRAKLGSKNNTAFIVQFFATPPADGNNQGKVFLGQKTVKTDDTGQVVFTFTSPVAVGASDFITATATNKKTGDTSEFSAPIQ